MRTQAWTWILVAAAACGQVKNDAPDAATDAPLIDAVATDASETDATAIDATSIDAAIDAIPIDAFTCTANAFERCEGTSTVVCNGTGTGVVTTDCGAPGCNATAGRCNTCVPSTSSCAGATVTTCGADGLPGPTETCALSCTATPTAHCAYLQPVYLPNICDAPATVASFTATTDSIDTGVDINCNGGIVTQSGGSPICVLRYGTITVPAGVTMTFIGGRAVALVADGLLDVRGTIDASARGTASGPGGGTRALTALANANNGAGGAGGYTAGAAGGNNSPAAGGGHAGGPAFDPLTVAALIGGQRAAQPSLTLGISGGGGGGALTLISCRGTTRVSGLIDVGGGGGNGGQDQLGGAQYSPVGAGGGGAGGYAVLQGLAVTATGAFFANGGGGGGGAANDTTGNPGSDGLRSASTPAPGGLTNGGGSANGGLGSLGTSAPGIGAGASSPGGGGGAGGFFQSYTPVGVNATITPSSVSPPFASNRNTQTR